jgi:hypothetical protein
MTARPLCGDKEAPSRAAIGRPTEAWPSRTTEADNDNGLGGARVPQGQTAFMA